MPKFAISVAMTTAVIALSASVPASAEYYAGPTHRNDGKCFTYSRFQNRDGAFGYWASCDEQRKAGCMEEGAKSAGYFGSCSEAAKAASAKNAKNNPRRRPATASR